MVRLEKKIQQLRDACVREKAIYEFAEKVKYMAENKWIYDLCEDKDCEDFVKDIYEIAKQLTEEN